MNVDDALSTDLFKLTSDDVCQVFGYDIPATANAKPISDAPTNEASIYENSRSVRGRSSIA